MHQFDVQQQIGRPGCSLASFPLLYLDMAAPAETCSLQKGLFLFHQLKQRQGGTESIVVGQIEPVSSCRQPRDKASDAVCCVYHQVAFSVCAMLRF